jgi:hypothetical protein
MTTSRQDPIVPEASEPHERVERLAGAIYGTIAVAGVLAATEYEEQPEALDTGVYALSTVVVLWVAHAWAQTVGRRLVGGGPLRHALRHSLGRDWPLVQSALPPLAAMALGGLLGASDQTAINIGFWVCVASLGAWGAIVAHREHASPLRTVTAALGCAMLGLLLVVLKELVG